MSGEQFDRDMDEVIARIQNMTDEANSAVPGWDGKDRREEPAFGSYYAMRRGIS